MSLPKSALFKRVFLALGLFSSVISLAQTDATIFREFQFDFATPGARANAMGRAFVGLADEATAAYSNPAGLSVLEKPEFTIEGRQNLSFFSALKKTDRFSFSQATPEDSEFKRDNIGFASLSYSFNGYNLSAFFVNNLDYHRDNTDDTTSFIDVVNNYEATLINKHFVRKIELDTEGISISRNFGKLSVGVALSLVQLDLDFQYNTKYSSFTGFLLFNSVVSSAKHKSLKPGYVIGSLYQATPKLKLGFSYKIQPRFVYEEQIVNRRYDDEAVPVTFKIPDSVQVGLAYQPDDLWTVLFDVDWTQYKQLGGKNLTLFSEPISPRVGPTPYHFKQSEYVINQDPSYRMGTEYLMPVGHNIIAFRAGGFFDPDHRTRFVGDPPPETGELVRDRAIAFIYSMQDFLYNNGKRQDNSGITGGVGFVWHNKVQFDLAYIHSERYHRAVASLLYRF